MKQHIRSTENIHSTKKSPYFDLHAKTLSIFLADLADSADTDTICVFSAIYACQNIIYFFRADLADSADTDTICVFCAICACQNTIYFHADLADSAETHTICVFCVIYVPKLYIFSADFY